jgi:hypothetical protein
MSETSAELGSALLDGTACALIDRVGDGIGEFPRGVEVFRVPTREMS